jgi:hypothetical protein
MVAAPPSEFVKALAGALAGGLGGMVSAFVLFPMDVIKTRQQSGDKLPILRLTTKLIKEEGVFGLWNGSIFSAFQSLCEKAGYFFGYTLLRNIYRRVTGGDAGTLATLAIGYCSEWSHLFFTLPLDKVKVLKVNRMGQTELPTDIITLCKEVWKAGGLHNGAGGFQLLALKPATQFAVYEPAKSFWLRRQGGGNLSSAAAFLLGAFSRLISDSFIYPGRRAKVQKQALGKLGPDSTEDEKVSCALAGCLLARAMSCTAVVHQSHSLAMRVVDTKAAAGCYGRCYMWRWLLRAGAAADIRLARDSASCYRPWPRRTLSVSACTLSRRKALEGCTAACL